jgi:YlmC/YmxH family sporulation protein
MESTLEDLRWKEVIGTNNGIRYGYVSDVVIDLSDGCVKALVVPGRARWFGLFGYREPRLIRWKDIRHIGEDIILVEGRPESWRRRGEKRKLF